MYGLTLRHGWGCGKNEKAGFKWLMKAAESAVSDLERMRMSGGQADVGVVQVRVIGLEMERG
jgi:TPR repeat protein